MMGCDTIDNNWMFFIFRSLILHQFQRGFLLLHGQSLFRYHEVVPHVEPMFHLHQVLPLINQLVKQLLLNA